MNRYCVLLYYCYNTIKDPVAFRARHHLYCLDQGLLGRIIIAEEGINGTISGLRDDCKRYMSYLKSIPGFEDTDFKVAPHHTHAFQKLHVRVKPEIVHSGLGAIDVKRESGRHVSPIAFKRMRAQEDTVVLDVRSKCEHRLGKFKGAVTLDLNHFRDFKNHLAALEPYKDKKIITVCTGNVKCEKASAYLLKQGFKHVYQLRGGIIRYGLATDGVDFEGTCYVFDNRVTVPINKANPSIIASCHACQIPCERQVNCANPTCNVHVPLCTTCADRLSGACSQACQKHPRSRHYDGTGYYTTTPNGYNARLGLRRPK